MSIIEIADKWFVPYSDGGTSRSSMEAAMREAVAAARRQALEECLKIAEETRPSWNTAIAIRALIERDDEKGE